MEFGNRTPPGGKGGSPQDILTNSTFLPEHSFMLKSYRWWGGGGGGGP